MLNQLSKKVANYLGLDEIPIEFGKMKDDSILITKGISKIVINEKYNGIYLECAKSITHEYRHAFQIMMVAVMPEDPMSKVWKEELQNAIVSGNSGYEIQAVELDAFAFTQVYLKTHEGIATKYPNEKYQEMIEMYIERYKRYL